MGDCEPSLTSLVPDVFFRSIWFSRLPHNVQAILAYQPGSELDAAALCVDRIIEEGVTD
jgi:hypothetical protein